MPSIRHDSQLDVRISRRRSTAVVCLAAALTGCCGTDCWNDDLNVGRTYTFTIRELRPPGPRSANVPCDPSLPPLTGDALKLRVVDEHPTAGAVDCSMAVGELQGEHSLNIVEGPLLPGVPIGTASGARIISTAVFIDWNGCRGTWSLLAIGRSDDRDPFVPYRTGNPATVLYRAFTPDPASLPSDPAIAGMCNSCADHFGVQITK